MSQRRAAPKLARGPLGGQRQSEATERGGTIWPARPPVGARTAVRSTEVTQ
jgi:hypothetical protein